MSTVRAQIRIPRDNALPADDVINTFHFGTTQDPPSSTELDQIVQQLTDFYTAAVVSESASIVNRMAGYMNGPIQYKLYDIGDAEPRQPIRVGTFAATFPTSGSPYPAEVALVLSLRAAVPSGVDPRRRRGRVYLGPFNAESPSFGNTGDARPSQGLINIITGAAKRMMDAGAASGVPSLAVYSEVGFATSEVISCRVNNAWDTQRRRGADPTANTDVVRV